MGITHVEKAKTFSARELAGNHMAPLCSCQQTATLKSSLAFSCSPNSNCINAPRSIEGSSKRTCHERHVPVLPRALDNGHRGSKVIVACYPFRTRVMSGRATKAVVLQRFNEFKRRAVDSFFVLVHPGLDLCERTPDEWQIAAS